MPVSKVSLASFILLAAAWETRKHVNAVRQVWIRQKHSKKRLKGPSGKGCRSTEVNASDSGRSSGDCDDLDWLPELPGDGSGVRSHTGGLETSEKASAGDEKYKVNGMDAGSDGSGDSCCSDGEESTQISAENAFVDTVFLQHKRKVDRIEMAARQQREKETLERGMKSLLKLWCLAGLFKMFEEYLEPAIVWIPGYKAAKLLTGSYFWLIKSDSLVDGLFESLTKYVDRGKEALNNLLYDLHSYTIFLLRDIQAETWIDFLEKICDQRLHLWNLYLRSLRSKVDAKINEKLKLSS